MTQLSVLQEVDSFIRFQDHNRPNPRNDAGLTGELWMRTRLLNIIRLDGNAAFVMRSALALAVTSVVLVNTMTTVPGCAK